MYIYIYVYIYIYLCVCAHLCIIINIWCRQVVIRVFEVESGGQLLPISCCFVLSARKSEWMTQRVASHGVAISALYHLVLCSFGRKLREDNIWPSADDGPFPRPPWMTWKYHPIQTGMCHFCPQFCQPSCFGTEEAKRHFNPSPAWTGGASDSWTETTAQTSN